MTALTPEAARAAAEWLETLDPCGYPSAAYVMRREADRLENASKTPGQVLAEINEVNWSELPQDIEDNYERSAAAVIAHHVGPDRVVVERADLKLALYAFDNPTATALSSRRFARLREALS